MADKQAGRKALVLSRKIDVALNERSYAIQVQPGIIKEAAKYFEPITANKKSLIISDNNVYTLYGKPLENALDSINSSHAHSIFPAGEESKTLITMANHYHNAVKAGLDRRSIIIALGGGVPGDIAGFVAATYMRGIDFIQVPTSLLAMVDSSVGGKTGVDLPEGKNLVGAFWQPKLVLIDPETLNTLPEKEIKCGLAEIVKYAVIMDKDFFKLLEENIAGLNSLDLELYTKIIAHCCKLKAEVVAQDEREGGLRAILNYGHTFGHAIEAVADFQIGHGEGVAIGMSMAADLAVKLGMLDESDSKRQEALMEKLGLPYKLNAYDPQEIFRAMSKDKKVESGSLRLVLPNRIGEVTIKRDIDNDLILNAIKGRIIS
jgi:3-dehydroquinate synthase